MFLRKYFVSVIIFNFRRDIWEQWIYTKRDDFTAPQLELLKIASKHIILPSD